MSVGGADSLQILKIKCSLIFFFFYAILACLAISMARTKSLTSQGKDHLLSSIKLTCMSLGFAVYHSP